MKWFQGPIQSAIAEAKIKRKIFLVFVEGDDEASKSMAEAFDATDVSESLTNECVAIKLPTNSEQFKQFSQIYPVIIVPSSFFIGIDGIPLDIVGGKQTIDEFQAKIGRVVELHKSKVVKFDDANQLSENEGGGGESSAASSNTPPLDEKLERAKQLIEERRLQKSREYQEEEKKKEMEKRRLGKELQKFKEDQQKKEMLDYAQQRQKEKVEDKLARERIKAQIAQDRADRAARYQIGTSAAQEVNSESTVNRPAEVLPQASTSNSNSCRIQFRLPNASTRTHEFPASERMKAVFEYVERDIGFSNVLLATTFPRRQFNQRENGNSTLRELQLVPSAVLIIIPKSSMPGTSLSTVGGAGGIFAMFSMMMSPVFFVWNFVMSFLGRSGSQSGNNSTPQPMNSNNPRNIVTDTATRPTASNPVSGSASSSGSDNGRSPAVANPGSSSPASQRYRREGNIHRLANEAQDDSDENNTWNGNSTQQL